MLLRGSGRMMKHYIRAYLLKAPPLTPQTMIFHKQPQPPGWPLSPKRLYAASGDPMAGALLQGRGRPICQIFRRKLAHLEKAVVKVATGQQMLKATKPPITGFKS